MSTAVEQRLAAALEARAELVGPEHLTPSPLPDPALPGPARLDPGDPGDAGEPGPGAWRRRATYAAVAAAAVAVLAVPVWLADGPGERRPAPADVPAPDGWVGGTGRTGPGADLPGNRVSTDLDGDGAPDTLWLRAPAPEGPAGPVRLEALLSSDPDEVRWTVLRRAGSGAQLEGAYGPGGLDLRLDDEPGSEVLVLFEPEGADQYGLAAVDLVGGRLVEADVDAGDTGAPFALGLDADRRRVHFGVLDDARLVTARTREPATDEVRYRRSQAWTWDLRAPTAPGERPVLVPTPRDDVCRDDYGYGFGDCRPGSDRPLDLDPPVGEGDNPSDVVPDFYPDVTRRLGPGEAFRFTSVAGAGTAGLARPEEAPRLEVELDGTAYAATLPAGLPATLVAGTVAAEAGPGFLVVRGADGETDWSVWQVRDGALVEV
ncbi:hypothetical protein [Nocardioides perillae]|uniref:Uncharacterized protein n=1 Tax=Nocardioides perillae TaxID=1119534 RepID=A0A7Y9RS64_9ACTN|nr:hypothetical protein [Nocardioides perillae]NYG54301.1 hypothetical protein [Nocardioides perillae]